MKKKYKQIELNKVLDLVEQGYSYSEVADDFRLNKSIVAREMRKRKNKNADNAHGNYMQSLMEENYKTFVEQKK